MGVSVSKPSIVIKMKIFLLYYVLSVFSIVQCPWYDLQIAQYGELIVECPIHDNENGKMVSS